METKETMRLIIIDNDVMHTLDSEKLSNLTRFLEDKGYEIIGSLNSLCLGYKKESIGVVLRTFKDIDDTARAIELFDQLCFRPKFKNSLFKIVNYKGHKLLIDEDNVVARFSSREKPMRIGDTDSIEIIESNLGYEIAFQKMYKIMKKELKKKGV